MGNPLFLWNNMKFRPCIDLHDGQVKQIVGSTLKDDAPNELLTNFTADKSSEWYAQLYKRDQLVGGHIIKLGPGNDEAAEKALAVWPDNMQIGGGINSENAARWLEAGASHVIVTSCVFSDGIIDDKKLDQLVGEVGKHYLVLDLSCRKKGDDYFIVTDRWQKFTEVTVTAKSLRWLSNYCDEFLIHAADVEGKCQGVELDLIRLLGEYSPLPTTYAGGIRNLSDMELILKHGQGKLDTTVGSALDIFGGKTMTYNEAVAFHNQNC